MLKKWIEFFLYEGKEDEKMKVLLTDGTIKKAHEEYQKFTADEKMQRLYDARWKQMMDYNSLMASARREGLEQGFEEGIEKGIEKGIKKGIEKGIAEGEYKGGLKTARRMLEAGLSVDDIAKLTTLSLQEIEKLKEN